MTEEEQTKALEDAKNQVKVQAFYMKRNLVCLFCVVLSLSKFYPRMLES